MKLGLLEADAVPWMPSTPRPSAIWATPSSRRDRHRHLVVGSVFNLVAHSKLDRSHDVQHANAFPKTLQKLITSSQLIDSWRAHNVGPERTHSTLQFMTVTLV